MNTNCLEGIRCPTCGNEDRFMIEATAWVEVLDSGIDDYEETDWTDDSSIVCQHCYHFGTVKKFTISPPPVAFPDILITEEV
jgi:hypothetical protein